MNYILKNSDGKFLKKGANMLDPFSLLTDKLEEAYTLNKFQKIYLIGQIFSVRTGLNLEPMPKHLLKPKKAKKND